MPELVLPANLSPGEIRCAEEVAKDLQLETEKVGNPTLSHRKYMYHTSVNFCS